MDPRAALRGRYKDMLHRASKICASCAGTPDSLLLTASLIQLARNYEMRLGRLPTDSVNRKDVLGTRGKHNYAIHLGDQRHPVARPTYRRTEFEHFAVLYRDIHEKV